MSTRTPYVVVLSYNFRKTVWQKVEEHERKRVQLLALPLMFIGVQVLRLHRDILKARRYPLGNGSLSRYSYILAMKYIMKGLYKYDKTTEKNPSTVDAGTNGMYLAIDPF